MSTKLRDDVRQLHQDFDAALPRLASVLERVERMLAVSDVDDGQAAAPAPAAGAPATLPVAGKPTSFAPAPVASPTFPIILNIHATEWLNKTDDETGETAKQPMYPWAPRNAKGCGLTTIGVSVPMHVLPGDGVRVRLSKLGGIGAWVYARIIEGGPHRTNDEYLRTGARPIAEKVDKNQAALDFTPAFMSLVTGKTAQECYDGEESVTVDAQFVPASEMPDDAHLIFPDTHVFGSAVVAAARALPVPFPYAPETKGGNLGCADVVSTALRNAGVPIPIILGVDDLAAALVKLGWKTAAAADYADGNVIIWAAIPESNGHKHVGILAHEGSQLSAINNSSSQAKVIEELLATKNRPIERVLAPPA